MTIIQVKTADQVLSAVLVPKLAPHNQNSVKLTVDFDSAWDGYGKSAVFYTKSNSTPFEKVLDANDSCLVPPEVLAEPGYLFITVKGVKTSDNSVKASARLKLKVSEGMPLFVVSEPSEDVYKQLLGAYERTGSAIAVERARIDMLESETTPHDSELIGLRIGADATVYDNAGTAVRAQFTKQSDEITGNKKNFVEQCGAYYPAFLWEMGSILDSTYTTRIRTANFTRAVGDIVVTPGEGYRVGVMLYQIGEGGYVSVSDTGWKTTKHTVTGASGYYYKVHISRSDGADMSVGESENVTVAEILEGARLDAAYACVPVTEKLFADVYNNICGVYVPVHEWEQGSYVTDSNTQTDRIRTKAGVYYQSLGNIAVMVGEGYRVGLRIYTLNNGVYTMSYDTGWRTGAFEVPNSNGVYYRLCMSANDGTTEIGAAEHSNVTVSYSLNEESELKKLGKKVQEAVKINASSATVKTVAHRGDVLSAPECTEPSYIAARKRGHTIAENDLRISKDGEFVMWHDPTLSKLGNIVNINGYSLYTDTTAFYWYDAENDVVYTYSDGEYVESAKVVSQLTLVNGANYSVADFNLETLKQMDFGVWYSAAFAGTQILTFAEWVMLCKKLGMDIYVDYKFTYTKEQAEELVATVRRAGMLRHTSWICNSTMANYIRYYDPKARIGFLTIPTAANVQTYSAYLKAGSVFYDGNAIDITSESAALGLDAGFDVECYYVAFGNTDKETVFEKYRQLFDIGVTTITTDHYHVGEAYDYMLE